MRLTSSASQQGVDWDGLLMLVLSTLFILATLGLSWLWLIFKTYRTAQQAPTPSQIQRPLIVFGKQLHHNQIDNDYRARLQRVLALQTDQPIFVLGGITAPNSVSEAKAGETFLLHRQPSLESQLILEESSRNTLENLKQARLFLARQDNPLQVDLLSNRYHLYRCQALAKGLGFDVTLVAAEDRLDGHWTNCYKIFMEAFFSHWYHTGARVSRWLNNKRMLAKIH